MLFINNFMQCFLEELINIGPSFGGYLKVGKVELPKFILSDITLNASLRLKVGLVPHNKNERLLSSHLVHFRNPIFHTSKGL
jgi:hypothetical protein